MGLRFFRRVRVLPGMTINLSKSGASMSFGVRGAHYTVGPRGRRVTVGLPGTGLYYTQSKGSGRAGSRAVASGPVIRRQAPAPVPITPPPNSPKIRPEGRLTPGFFQRLVTPPEEQELVAALRDLTAGDEVHALTHLRAAAHLADGAFLAGLLALKTGSLDEALADLQFALDHVDRLGRGLERYGVKATVSLRIAEGLTAHLPPSEEGVLLGLVEVYERLQRSADARDCLTKLQTRWPDDPVVLASRAELRLEAGDRTAAQEVVTMTNGVSNSTPVHTVVLLYRARALRLLGLPDACVETTSKALTQPKDRSDELQRELRYERALAYGEMGDARRARTELERIYADDSTFADVARRLGVPSGQTASSS